MWPPPGLSARARQSGLLLFAAEIVTEEFAAVFVLMTIETEIFPVGAIRGIIPGIAVLVMDG
jgi:hypothetical protein